MRVATYSQPAALGRASFVGIAVLVLTILLGTKALDRAMFQFVPATLGLITPLWLGLYAAAFVGLMAGHGVNWLSWLVRYRILLVVLMLGTAASVGWALDAHLSLERSVHLLGSTLLAIYIGFTVPLLTTLRVLGVVLGVLLVASLGAVLVLPSMGIEDYAGVPVWRGVFVTKNGLGFWAAIGVLLFVALSDSVAGFFTRMSCFLMAALGLGLLVFSQSATSLVVMLLAGALSLYLYIAMRFRLGFVRMAVLALLIGGLATFAVLNVPSAELIGRSDDLTGRGEVWAQTWNLIMQRPVTGYGYGVLWFPSAENRWIQESLTDFTWTVHHAHNGFLQVASEIGLPLAVVALLMVVQQLIEIVYCQYQRQQAGVLFVLAFSVAYLISNVSEARFLVNRELFWILFIALPISMLRQINLSAAPRAARATPAAARGAEPSRPSAARAALQRGIPARTAVPWNEQASESSPWVAAAAARAARSDPGVTAVHIGDDGAEHPLDVHDADEDDALFDQDEMDATLGSLTLADADIDLGQGPGQGPDQGPDQGPGQGTGRGPTPAPDLDDDWIDPDATLEHDRGFEKLFASVRGPHGDGDLDADLFADDSNGGLTGSGAERDPTTGERADEVGEVDDPLDRLQDLDDLPGQGLDTGSAPESAPRG